VLPPARTMISFQQRMLLEAVHSRHGVNAGFSGKPISLQSHTALALNSNMPPSASSPQDKVIGGLVVCAEAPHLCVLRAQEMLHDTLVTVGEGDTKFCFASCARCFVRARAARVGLKTHQSPMPRQD